MADQQPSTSDVSSGGPTSDVSSGGPTSDVSSDSPESSVELNIKTLNSQIHSFVVDKNMTVSAFKEKIAGRIGLPVEQQRLIFRGKVLKDDHLLSEYHVENGHTLHLVERQSSQPLPSSGANIGDASSNNSGRVGQEPGVGVSRNRVGQISHSVVLGTFNVGEQGEGTMPDLSRVIGSVLNSFGLGNQPGIQPSMQVPQRSASEGTTNGANSQSQGVNQSQMGQPFVQPFTGQSLPQVMQIPVGAAIALPSLNMPIPDSLNTIFEFVNRLEQAMSQHGYQPSQSPPVTDDLHTTQLPAFPRGVPTPEALSIVLRRVQHLIGGQAMAALSHVAGHLEMEAGSNDPTVRGQIQTESVQVGLAMQHLGALLLELGRAMLTLRMGQSPAESSVSVGPAVYVSPSGPNPIMVQPFPLQSTSMFGNSAVPPNSGTFGPVGLGNISRNVNIHIHTGASLAPFVSGVGTRPNNTEGTQGGRVDGTSSSDSGPSQVHPMRNFNLTAVPIRPAVVAVPSAVEVGISVSPPDLFPRSGEVNPQGRNSSGNVSRENQASSGQSESSSVQQQVVGSGTGNDDMSEQNISSSDGLGKTTLPFSEPRNGEVTGVNVNSKSEPSSSSVKSEPPSSSVGGTLESLSSPKVTDVASISTQGLDKPGSSSSTPLGLGTGGLQPKRRMRQSRSQHKGDDPLVTSSQPEQTGIAGQQVFQSLASFGARNNVSTSSGECKDNWTSGQLQQPSGRDGNADAQFDIGDAMSHMLQSPGLNSLLAGVSQQTGIGSPNALRNIMEQITQNPAMRNTVNAIAQQIENHNLGDMLALRSGESEGDGFDLSRIMQQMLPIVSQALGGASTGPSPTLRMGPDPTVSMSRRDVPSIVENSSQVDLQQVAQRIEQQSPPEEIFRSVVENAVQSYEGDNINLVEELCSNMEGISAEFIEMLSQDLRQRVRDERNGL